MSLPFRVSLSLTILGVLAFGVLTPLAAANPIPKTDPLADEEAVRDLQTLTRYLKDRNVLNSQIVEYLNLVSSAYVADKASAAQAPVPADAKAQQSPRMKRSEFRERAEKQFFRALRLQRVRNEVNQRDEVNRFAANALAKLAQAFPGQENAAERERLSRQVRRQAKKWQKAKHELNPQSLTALFNALAALGSMESLEWMLDEFVHTKSRETAWLVAAHTAMVKFPAQRSAADKAGRSVVPGKLRLTIVDDFIKGYASVETAANTSRNDPGIQAAKRFWDDVKNTTIPVLQHFSQQPRDPESGVGLASVREFRSWYRKHRNPRRAPWIDPK